MSRSMSVQFAVEERAAPGGSSKAVYVRVLRKASALASLRIQPGATSKAWKRGSFRIEVHTGSKRNWPTVTP